PGRLESDDPQGTAAPSPTLGTFADAVVVRLGGPRSQRNSSFMDSNCGRGERIEPSTPRSEPSALGSCYLLDRGVFKGFVSVDVLARRPVRARVAQVFVDRWP